MIEAREQAAAARRDPTFLLRKAELGESSIRRCAWCDRFEVGGEWLELDVIGSGTTQIRTELMERATHGICDDCLKEQKHITHLRMAHRLS